MANQKEQCGEMNKGDGHIHLSHKDSRKPGSVLLSLLSGRLQGVTVWSIRDKDTEEDEEIA